MARWERDEGYSGCKTTRFGNHAVVICPPDFTEDGWGYQVFDESDWDAVESGDREYEGYGFKNERAVMEFVGEYVAYCLE